MRPRTSRTLVAALAACAGLAVAGPATPAASLSGGPGASRCDVVTGYREKTVQSLVLGSATSAEPGNAVVYQDEIYDASGATVGRAVGYATIVEVRASDGHEFVYYAESLRLPGGMLRDSGTIDATVVHQGGGWARFPAVGTAGTYLGRKGVREWRIISVGELLVELRVVMCR
jgi:hypothetical protein